MIRAIHSAASAQSVSGWISPAFDGRLDVRHPECGDLGDEPADAEADACGERLGLLLAQLEDQRARRLGLPAGQPHSDGDLLVESGDRVQSRAGFRPERIVEPDDGRAEQFRSCRGSGDTASRG